MDFEQFMAWRKSMHSTSNVLMKGFDNTMQNCRLKSIWAEHEKDVCQGVQREKPYLNKEHHDNKWKYRQTFMNRSIENDSEIRNLPAEIIVYGKVGSHVVDSISLGKTNIEQWHLLMPNKSTIGVGKQNQGL
eukprot:8763086-Heterocapsa_arctica.AAC.1